MRITVFWGKVTFYLIGVQNLCSLSKSVDMFMFTCKKILCISSLKMSFTKIDTDKY